MFGQNPIRSIVNEPLSLALETHFYTLQGEGPYSGMPALFIRLAGCNLACHFCDTQFETQADNLRLTDEIVAELIAKYTEGQRKFVVITGGEPLRQDFSRLAEALYATGTKLIQVETAGTLWQPSLTSRIQIGDMVLVCSPKTPKVHVMVSSLCKHWKYVVTHGELSLEDGLPNRGTQNATKDKEVTLFRPVAHYADPYMPRNEIWVSPCDQYDPEKNRRNMFAARNSALMFGHRLSLQVHKIVEVE
jgi:organic radical activating enzyme